MDGRITRGTCSEPSKACLLERVETLGDEDARVQSLSGRPVEGRLWAGGAAGQGGGRGPVCVPGLRGFTMQGRL